MFFNNPEMSMFLSLKKCFNCVKKLSSKLAMPVEGEEEPGDSNSEGLAAFRKLIRYSSLVRKSGENSSQAVVCINCCSSLVIIGCIA